MPPFSPDQLAAIGVAYTDGLMDGMGDGADSDPSHDAMVSGWTDHCPMGVWKMLHSNPMALSAAREAYASGYLFGRHNR